MAYKYVYRDHMYYGNSADAKPATAEDGEKCYELDTGAVFVCIDNTWHLM
jgi:hypothetical protein